jgi:hypothetical protein
MRSLDGRRCGEVEADEFFFAAKIEPLLRENGAGPARVKETRNLPARDLFDLLGVWLVQAEESALAQGNQITISKNRGSAAKNVGCRFTVGALAMPQIPKTLGAIPFDFARREFDAAKAAIRFVASAKRVKMSVDEIRA